MKSRRKPKRNLTIDIAGGEATLNAANAAHRMAEPEEIAEGAVWLCSPRSRYVVGHGLVIDGGQSVQ